MNSSNQRIVFLDRDGVINQEPGPILRVQDFKFIPQSIEAIRCINEQGWLCIVITNQGAIAGGKLSEETFGDICDFMNAELKANGAYIDDLFYCPHYPKHRWKEGMREELVFDCDCRKPKIGLFQQAQEKYPFQPSQAVFIGDTTSDFEAGHRLGIPVIGVKTGHAGQDGKCDRTPTDWADNLYSAIQQLIENWPEVH